MIIEYHEDIHDKFKKIVTDVTVNMRETDYLELSALVDNPTPQYFVESVMYYPYRKFVALHEGKGAAVGGISKWYSGNGVLWLWGTNDFPKVAKSATREAKRTMDRFFDEGGHRLECLSMATHSNVHRWLEFLGLELEHVKKSCGKNREDFYLYSKVI